MKVAVLGSGAMGCLYGGTLAEAGHQVTFIDVWAQHVQALNEQGLLIEENGKEKLIRKNFRAVTSPGGIGPVDLVIVFVKATLTEVAMEEAKPLLGPNTIVLTLQNGLGNVEKLNWVAGREHVIAGTTAHGSTILGPGHIRHAGKGKTIIGEQSGETTRRIEQLAEAFQKAGFETEISSNVMGLIWTKLIVNIGINALTAVTGLKNGRLLEFPEVKSLMEKAVQEACDVARAKGIRLEIANPQEHVAKIAQATAENRSSMLQDVTNKRMTEISVINGAIVAGGKEVGVPTPINEVLTALIETKQKTYNLTD